MFINHRAPVGGNKLPKMPALNSSIVASFKKCLPEANLAPNRQLEFPLNINQVLLNSSNVKIAFRFAIDIKPKMRKFLKKKVLKTETDTETGRRKLLLSKSWDHLLLTFL